MTKYEERQEITETIDRMIETLGAIRNRVMNYEYTRENVSDAQVVVFSAHELKHLVYEAMVESKKK